MNLDKKIKKSSEFIKKCLQKSNKPVIMTSFGKDSMVLIDLISKVTEKIPDCICNKEPYFPKKYRFCHLASEYYNLNVFDFPPAETAIQSVDLDNGEEEIEIVNYYNLSLDNNLKAYILPTGIIGPSEDKDYLCGLNDLYFKPLGLCNFKWDCMFIGHKSSDKDVFYDSLELNTDFVDGQGDSPDLAYPLKDWTDEDIWNYIDKYNVPWNKKRYFREDVDYPEKDEMLFGGIFRGQFKDMTFNNDYIEACTLCMSKRQPEKVFCPKLQKEIDNISSKLNYIKPKTFNHWK